MNLPRELRRSSKEKGMCRQLESLGEATSGGRAAYAGGRRSRGKKGASIPTVTTSRKDHLLLLVKERSTGWEKLVSTFPGEEEREKKIDVSDSGRDMPAHKRKEKRWVGCL